MEKYELNKNLEVFEENISGFYRALDVKSLKLIISELEEKINDPNVWDDPKSAQEYISKNNDAKKKVQIYEGLDARFEDLKALIEMYDEEPSDEIWSEIESETETLKQEIEETKTLVLLNEKYDNSDAIMELHPGAGGTESMDWASMLFRMYTRYAQRHNFKLEVLDYEDGDEAGIKSVTFRIKGEYAYGYLKAERGVHRLVRISPFDANSRRHTSFCSCDVAPELKDGEDDIVINEEDLKVDTFCSSGPGGQGVNTTYSAVRITHKPTGIVVSCQTERSQIKNRATCMSILKSKLLQEKIRKQEEELASIKGEQKDIAWGSQIRSYVFCPYTLVKDHRTDFEMGDVNSVMDGNIDGFINEYLKKRAESKNGQ